MNRILQFQYVIYETIQRAVVLWISNPIGSSILLANFLFVCSNLLLIILKLVLLNYIPHKITVFNYI